MICFDTSIVDLTEQLNDPVEVLFGVQLGGGTDINSALAYCEQHIENPIKTHLILISDLYDGGNAESMLARIAAAQTKWDQQHARRTAHLTRRPTQSDFRTATMNPLAKAQSSLLLRRNFRLRRGSNTREADRILDFSSLKWILLSGKTPIRNASLNTKTSAQCLSSSS